MALCLENPTTADIRNLLGRLINTEDWETCDVVDFLSDLKGEWEDRMERENEPVDEWQKEMA